MQRIVIPGGRLTAPQWRTLAAVARRHTPDTLLHLTTRQDVELHDVRPEAVPEIHLRLADAGLTTLGAGGDTVRNTTVCPCSGLAPDCPDLLPLAWQIEMVIRGYANVYRLPRKFKISLSACAEACGRPWVNDIGLVAQRQDGRWGLRVILAGSLGPRPATGISWKWLPPADIAPLVLAALRIFDAQGDRENRARARLRHVRQRVGDAAFLEMLQAAHDAARAEREWHEPPVHEPARPLPHRRVLTFRNGDVSPQAADDLADAPAGLAVRIACTHQVYVYGPDEPALRQALADRPALHEPARPQPCVVACPGTRSCKRGLADTNAAADAIRSALAGQPCGPIAVSGCPNGCTHSAVAAVGMTGLVRTIEGRRQEAFQLWLNGGQGRDARLAEPAGIVPAHAAASELAARLRPPTSEENPKEPAAERT